MIDGHSHMLAGLAKGQAGGVEGATPFDLSDLFRVMDDLGVEKLVTFVQETERIYKGWLGSNSNAIDLQTSYPDINRQPG